MIHSGSRNLGTQVAEIYQQIAIELNQVNGGTLPEDLCYLYGTDFEDYLHDVEICQRFARQNREKMAEIIMERTGLQGKDAFHTIHNYIDTEESEAKKNLCLDEYRKMMEGIYTTSVNEATLDEAPMAYKSLNDIIDVIGESVEVIDVMKPIYNFKASD